MAKFKILVIALLLKDNVIAKYGEEIDEELFTADVDTLLADGYIGVVEEAKALTKAQQEAKDKADAAAAAQAEKDAADAKAIQDAIDAQALKDADAAQALLDAQNVKTIAAPATGGLPVPPVPKG